MRGLPRGQLVQRTSLVVLALLVGHFFIKLHVVHEHLFHHMPHVAYGDALYRADHFHHDVNPHESNLLDVLAALATDGLQLDKLLPDLRSPFDRSRSRAPPLPSTPCPDCGGHWPWLSFQPLPT